VAIAAAASPRAQLGGAAAAGTPHQAGQRGVARLADGSATHSVRFDADSRRQYVRLAVKKNRSTATVAIARKLAVRLWWMWKLGVEAGQRVESGSHAG